MAGLLECEALEEKALGIGLESVLYRHFCRDDKDIQRFCHTLVEQITQRRSKQIKKTDGHGTDLAGREEDDKKWFTTLASIWSEKSLDWFSLTCL